MWARLKPKPRLSRRARRGLRLGARIEREHVYSRRAAEAIAAQHLAERPDYYRRLLRYIENPGNVIRAGKDPFQENAVIRKLQQYAWEKHGRELSYAEAKEAMRAMLLQGIHAQFKVIEGGKRRANPPQNRYVFGGTMDGCIPVPTVEEPKQIIGLRMGRNKFYLGMVVGHRIYEVDGVHVRRQWDDFYGGGNSKAYQFVPKGEFWIDSGLKYNWDKVCYLWHEVFEYTLMEKKGWKYTKAHLAANKAEQELRAYDSRVMTQEKFLQVVLGNLLEQFGEEMVEKILPYAEDIARKLNKL